MSELQVQLYNHFLSSKAARRLINDAEANGGKPKQTSKAGAPVAECPLAVGRALSGRAGREGEGRRDLLFLCASVTRRAQREMVAASPNPPWTANCRC